MEGGVRGQGARKARCRRGQLKRCKMDAVDSVLWNSEG